MDILHKQQLDDVDGFNLTFYALVEYDDPKNDFEEDEDVQKIYDGYYNWFCAKITASKLGIELSSTYLGHCCYTSYAEFIASDDHRDLVNEAIAEAKEVLKQLCQ